MKEKRTATVVNNLIENDKSPFIGFFIPLGFCSQVDNIKNVIKI